MTNIYGLFLRTRNLTKRYPNPERIGNRIMMNKMKYRIEIIALFLRPFYRVKLSSKRQSDEETDNFETRKILFSTETKTYQSDAPSAAQLKKRNGYRRLAWMITGISLIHALVFLTVEFIRPDWNHVDYALRLQRLRKLIAENPGKPIGIALGNSRTSMGLDSSTLSRLSNTNLFSMAFPGSGPVQNIVYLKRIFADGIRPDYVMIEIHPCIFFNPISETQHIIETSNRANLCWDNIGIRDLEVLNRYPDLDASITRDWLLNRTEIMRTHRDDWLILANSKWSFIDLRSRYNRFGFDDHGWLPLPFPPSSVTKEIKETVIQEAKDGYYSTLQKGEIGTRSVKAFEELIDLLEQSQIPCVLYTMPEGTIFHSWYSTKFESQFQDWLRSIQERHSVSLIDTRSWLSEDSFFDSHHLMPEGATQFAKRFGLEVLIPFLENHRLLIPFKKK